MTSKIENVPEGRVVSIDALRGFDMFWITGGTTFFRAFFKYFDNPLFNTFNEQLKHSKWDGFTFYDLIFPLFLFIVGVSMPFAINRRIEKGESKKNLYIHVIKRTLTLLFLGFIYNGFLDFDFSNFRYAGVLQRIAICYFFTAIIILNTNIRNQGIIAGSILVFYWLIMMLIPVPGLGTGVLTPEGSLAGYIDRLLLPGALCYGFGDNEGLLSTIPAISTTLIGVLAGHWLRTQFSKTQKSLGLLISGIIAIILALIWNWVFPINKILWTSSYVLYSAGWSLLLLCLFYWIIDVKGYKNWAFAFVVIGLNPITIYVLQSLFDFGIIVDIFVHGFIARLGNFEPVFYTFCLLMVKWLFLYFLFKKKIFLKA